jgi:hypothetical protein
MTVVTIPRYTSGTGSSSKTQVISKSDTVNFPFVTRAIYVGGTGTMTVVHADGTTTLFSALPAGTILPVECIRVNETGTDATLMVALF